MLADHVSMLGWWWDALRLRGWQASNLCMDPTFVSTGNLHSFFFLVHTKGELAHPVHHTVLETTSPDQGSELSSATMIPK